MGERSSSSLAPLDEVRFDPGQFLVACRSARVDRSIRHSPRRYRVELFARHLGHHQSSCVFTGVVESGTFLPVDLGLASAHRVRVAAHWASWADCVLMVRRRLPVLAEMWIHGFAHGDAPCFLAVRSCQQELADAGLEMPSWTGLSESLPVVNEESEPNQPKVGWQQNATRQTEHKVHPRRSVAWALRTQIDMFGHHRAACAEAGVLGRWEVAVAQICRGGWSSRVHKRFRERLGPRGFSTVSTAEESRSWQTGWPCSEAPNSQLTRLSIAPRRYREEEGCRCRRRGGGSGKTPWGEDLPWAMVEEPDWWYWLQKWVVEHGDCPVPSPPWPRHARCPFLRFHKVGLRRRGSVGGVPSSFAPRPVHFLYPCWTSARYHRFAKFPQHTKCCGMTCSRRVGPLFLSR